VFIQSKETLIQNENNFVKENTINGTCEGMLVESKDDECLGGGTCIGNCLNFEATECLARKEYTVTKSPSMIPSSLSFRPSHEPSKSRIPSVGQTILPQPSSNPSISHISSNQPSLFPTVSAYEIIDCFLDWELLSNSIKLTSSSEHEGAIFKLCPRTVFNVDLQSNSSSSPIIINRSYVTIQCGENGLRTDECVVYGGNNQFQIVGSPIGVQFIGVTLVGATGVPVIAAGDYNAEVTFSSCIFAVSVFILEMSLYSTELICCTFFSKILICYVVSSFFYHDVTV